MPAKANEKAIADKSMMIATKGLEENISIPFTQPHAYWFRPRACTRQKRHVKNRTKKKTMKLNELSFLKENHDWGKEG